jgi:hypothetical protein
MIIISLFDCIAKREVILEIFQSPSTSFTIHFLSSSKFGDFSPMKKNKLLCKVGDYPTFPFFLALLSTPPHLSPPNFKIDP